MNTTIDSEIIFFLEKYIVAEEATLFLNCCNAMGYKIDNSFFIYELNKVAIFNVAFGGYVLKKY